LSPLVAACHVGGIGRQTPPVEPMYLNKKLPLEYRLPPEYWKELRRICRTLDVDLIEFEAGQSQKFYYRNEFTDNQTNTKEKEMPRGKQNSTDKKRANGKTASKTVKWVNVRLDDTDGVAIEQYGDSRDNLLLDLAEISVRGGDFGVKWTDDGETVMAYCIVDDAAVENQRVGLSGYASNATDAITSLLYKLHIKLDGLPTAGSATSKPKYS